MSPYLTATIIFGLLGLAMLWSVQWMAKRTVYKPIRPEEGGVRDEQAARDEIKQLRTRQITTLAGVYIFLCVLTFAGIAVTPTVRKVSDALHPTATATVTNTPRPTRTPRPTSTPTMSSHTPMAAGTPGGNFLTSLAVSPTATLRKPSGGGIGGGSNPIYIYVTRVVNRIQTVTVYRTAIVTRQVYVTKPVYVLVVQTVIVTPTYTPIIQPPNPATATWTSAPPTETPVPPTPTETETVTLEPPSPTPTETPIP